MPEPTPEPLKPLIVEFIVDHTGVHFGWGIERGKIDPHRICLWGERHNSQVQSWIQEATLVERVNEQVVQFFDGTLAVDIKIPPNYPYQLYRQGERYLCAEGILRNS